MGELWRIRIRYLLVFLISDNFAALAGCFSISTLPEAFFLYFLASWEQACSFWWLWLCWVHDNSWDWPVFSTHPSLCTHCTVNFFHSTTGQNSVLFFETMANSLERQNNSILPILIRYLPKVTQWRPRPGTSIWNSLTLVT